MKAIESKIQELCNLLSDELDEEKIVAIGEPLIASLRDCWKSSPGNFSERHISTLKVISAQLNAVQDFIFEKMDFDYIKSKEDADELIGRLGELAQITSELAISQKINTEIRALNEKKKHLPFSSQSQRSDRVKAAIRQLNANAPRCSRKNCRAIMTIRESDSGYFWGCSAFPKCWYTQPLNASQWALFSD